MQIISAPIPLDCVVRPEICQVKRLVVFLVSAQACAMPVGRSVSRSVTTPVLPVELSVLINATRDPSRKNSELCPLLSVPVLLARKSCAWLRRQFS